MAVDGTDVGMKVSEFVGLVVEEFIAQIPQATGQFACISLLGDSRLHLLFGFFLAQSQVRFVLRFK